MRGPRHDILDCYRAALAAVDGRTRVREHLVHSGLGGPLYLVAIGKAAVSMTLGAIDALGPALVSGLVISKDGHGDPELDRHPEIRYLDSDHPVPGERSLAAGQLLVSFLTAAPADARFLFLGSGGASSLVELLPHGFDLAGLRRLNDWLLASGHDIATMNRVRKGCSRIKGGRLLTWLGGRKAWNLLISDVPGDDPAVIGSGLLVPDPAASLPYPPDLPGWVRRWLAAPQAEWPQARVESALVACNADACRAAAERAEALGYRAVLADQSLDGSVEGATARIIATLDASEPGITIWGGEMTLVLPEHPGRGGRNQHLALSVARSIASCDDLWLLAAGTDGTDGPGEDAGALVDGSSVTRGEDAGLDLSRALREADSGSFLAGSGDLLQTGPTGTNVMDIAIGLRLEAGAA